MIKHAISLCGFLSVLLPITAMVLLSSNNQFILFEDYLSLLGIGPYGYVFNGTLIISAILLAPVLASLLTKKERLLIAPIVISLIGITLIPIGPAIHRVFAAIGTVFFALVMTRVGIRTTGWFQNATQVMAGILGVGMAGFVILRIQNISFPPWAEGVLVIVIASWVVLASILLHSKKGLRQKVFFFELSR